MALGYRGPVMAQNLERYITADVRVNGTLHCVHAARPNVGDETAAALNEVIKSKITIRMNGLALTLR